MTNFSIPKSDREHWGLRGAVKVCREQVINPNAAPDALQPEMRLEYTLEGIQVGIPEIPFSFDQAGRKTRVRVSRPEDYRSISMGGSPFSLVDRRPNLPDGGTATTYYDEYDRPVEAQVRNSQDELVSSAIRLYDQMGRVTEEKLFMHHPADFFPADLRSHLSSASDQVKDRMKILASARSVEFFYDSGNQPSRTVRRDAENETTVVTSYNEQGDPEFERATTRAIVNSESSGSVLPYSENHYSYQYDKVGNWTEKALSHRSNEESAFELSITWRRTLEYF